MVPSIARQSVIIKCNQQASVLLGNYEFYYVAGLMRKLFNLDLTEEMEPQAMLTTIQSGIDRVTPASPQEKYLVKLVANFKPDDSLDDQMKELFRWGATEEKLWQVQI